MAHPLAAAIAAMTAFSSGFTANIDANMPIPAFSSFGDVTGHIVSQMPAGAQRVSDRGRIIELLQGKNQAASNRAVTLDVGVLPSATGTYAVSGVDGCNPYSAQLVVTDNGGIALGNAVRGLKACDTPTDDEFWDVFAAQVILFVTPNNVLYLTNGVQGIAFRKVG
ncbi:META domain-containing protein [Corynebacterium choanae]|uniref:Uncharacterized protein n=1 Tax=Corynebacterium choanae TaxID=1862358 RepID=A0A3G6J5N6_9CORY|nr:META domain-containing protein [Corynebacterium choanae]AZA13367.1 hypothetical protein CCHOA_04795 [Corynebacterium choanae]